MSHIRLTRRGRTRMFLIDYYSTTTPRQFFERILAGPVMVFLGISTYMRSEVEGFKVLNLIVAGVGLYYIFKPFIWLLRNWKMYASDAVDFKIDEKQISLEQEGEEICIPLEDFKFIREQKDFYSLTKFDGVKLYLPKEQLTNEEKEILGSV